MILGGKYAGKKAVIIRCYDDGQKGDESKGTVSRSYGHALVCGLAAEPRKVCTQKESNSDRNNLGKQMNVITTGKSSSKEQKSTCSASVCKL